MNFDNFTEKGSLAPLAIHSRSAESLRTDFGFRASYAWQIGPVLVEPSLRASWEHEYKYSALPITAGFAGIPGPSATFVGPSEGHDSAIVSAGVTAYWTRSISTYVSYDGQLGRGQLRFKCRHRRHQIYLLSLHNEQARRRSPEWLTHLKRFSSLHLSTKWSGFRSLNEDSRRLSV